MKFRLPQPGDELDQLVLTAKFQKEVVKLVNNQPNKVGKRNNKGRTDRHIWVKNTGTNRDFGELLQIDAMTQPSAALARTFHASPTMTAIEPIWHTNIDNLIVTNDLPANHTMAYRPQSWATVKVTVVRDSDRWVMVDPLFPERCITSDAGIYKILGVDKTNNLATVDLTQSQPIWHFELTQDPQTHPLTTTAKLLRLDGDAYADEVDLTDRTGLLAAVSASTGTQGQCLHVGNKFVVIDAVCK